ILRCADAKDPVDPAVEKRVAELIEILGHPEADGENSTKTREAIETLAKIGVPAVPQVVRTIIRNKAGSNAEAYSANTLARIGKPAIETVRKLWEPMDDPDRWKLMSFRGKFDYTAALPFALESLESNDEHVRKQAIDYLGEHREDGAREKLLKMLNAE